MSKYQVCADLEIGNHYQETRKQGQDALELIFNMQKSIQEDVYNYNWEEIRKTVGSLREFVNWNEEAIRDEYRELHQAITGIDSYPGHWKPWKTKHHEAMSRSFDELTENEKKELRMEWIDILHFFMNQGIALGMTPEMITNYYVAKNARNIERQKQVNGY